MTPGERVSETRRQLLLTPEARAAFWRRLAGLAGAIQDGDTRAQYVAAWRARFDALFPPAPPGLTDDEMLPDGSVATVSELGERDAARLKHMAAAWLERAKTWPPADAATAGRWAWELGRRVTAGLVNDGEAEDALQAVEKHLRQQLGGEPGNITRLDFKKGVTVDEPPPPSPEANAVIADFRRSFDIGRKRSFDMGRQLLDLKCAQFERTDMGNAERWLARYGQDYLYTTAKGWLGWDGRRYRVLTQEANTTPAEVMGTVFKTVRAIQDEARAVRASGYAEDVWFSDEELKAMEKRGEEDPRLPFGLNRLIHSGRKTESLDGKIAAWGRTSEGASKLACIANLAKRWVTVELSDFDTDPMLLNCQNGTLRFIEAKRRDGQLIEPARVELKPHDRADRLTKLTACDFDPEAPAPLFQSTVKWAQPGKERRRYLRQWMGYNLTGLMGEQIFQIWYGPLAANGKSTVGNVCREASGDYGDTINVETFLDEGQKKRGDQATPDLVRLPGVRFLTAGEPPKGAKINEALINSVTGGDPMNVRDNFRSFFRMVPIFKFTLWCNDLPAIPQGTAGIWRRVKVIPWEQHKAEHERDRNLPDKLKAEYAGVLAWMVRGLLDYLDNGFVEPDSVQLASADYKHDSDPLSSFLALCTKPNPSGRVQSSVMHAVFCAWAKAAGEREWTQKGFSQALKAKGIASKASNGMHWLGIELTKQVGDFVDHEGKVRLLDDMVEPDAAASATDAPPHPPAAKPDDDEVQW